MHKKNWVISDLVEFQFKSRKCHTNFYLFSCIAYAYISCVTSFSHWIGLSPNRIQSWSKTVWITTVLHSRIMISQCSSNYWFLRIFSFTQKPGLNKWDHDKRRFQNKIQSNRASNTKRRKQQILHRNQLRLLVWFTLKIANISSRSILMFYSTANNARALDRSSLMEFRQNVSISFIRAKLSS
jgi:hypothetical protein